MAESKPKKTVRMRQERQLAEVALDPLAGGAAIAAKFSTGLFGAADPGETYDALYDRAMLIRRNKLGSLEEVLVGQAAALNAMFLELARRGAANMGEHIEATERYLRLSLKAQAQCRATLETLATLKNPPVYARQANISAGPQQVNNGAMRSESKFLPNEVLELKHGEGERLEPGTACTTIGRDSALEAVGSIDGASHGSGQDPIEPKRLQRRKAPGLQD